MNFFAGAVIASCLWVAMPARAQLNWGVKGGLNVSKVSPSRDLFNGDNKTGWFLGPMVEFKLPIIGVGVDAAALYSQAKLGVEGASNDMYLKSIEIPVNLKWSFGMGTAGAYIAAGPQFGFNVGRKNEAPWDLRDKYTTFNVGAGIRLLNHIQVGANYNFALGKTGTYSYRGESPATGDVTSEKVRNNTWQVSLAYLF